MNLRWILGLVLVLSTVSAQREGVVEHAKRDLDEASRNPVGFVEEKGTDPTSETTWLLCFLHETTGLTPDSCPPSGLEGSAENPQNVEGGSEGGDLSYLLGEVLGGIGEILQDPSSAPDVITSIVSAVLDFVERLLPILQKGASEVARTGDVLLQGIHKAWGESSDLLVRVGRTFEGASSWVEGIRKGLEELFVQKGSPSESSALMEPKVRAPSRELLDGVLRIRKLPRVGF